MEVMWATSGGHPADIWTALGLHLEVIWTARGAVLLFTLLFSYFLKLLAGFSGGLSATASLGHLGASRGVLGAFVGSLGESWGRLGPSYARFS